MTGQRAASGKPGNRSSRQKNLRSPRNQTERTQTDPFGPDYHLGLDRLTESIRDPIALNLVRYVSNFIEPPLPRAYRPRDRYSVSFGRVSSNRWARTPVAGKRYGYAYGVCVWLPRRAGAAAAQRPVVRVCRGPARGATPRAPRAPPPPAPRLAIGRRDHNHCAGARTSTECVPGGARRNRNRREVGTVRAEEQRSYVTDSEWGPLAVRRAPLLGRIARYSIRSGIIVGGRRLYP